jgi:hypothetical protein
MKIDLAYCVELGRVVDMQEACLEFAVQDKYSKYNFLCSDATCRHSRPKGVRVTGVNHYKLPTEGESHMSPHYRVLDPHQPNCVWMELEAAEKEEIENEDGDVKDGNFRKKRRKLTHLVTRFVVPSADDQGVAQNEAERQLDEIRLMPSSTARRKAILQYARGAGATATSLEALVSCYEELKEVKELDREFSIPGKSRTSFYEAFRHVSEGIVNSDFVVRFGGARFVKDYGEGFSLTFMDKINEVVDGVVVKTPVSIYVSAENLRGYRPGRRFKKLIAEMRSDEILHPYLRVYWIGSMNKREKGGYGASFSSLAHVVIRLVYPQPT